MVYHLRLAMETGQTQVLLFSLLPTKAAYWIAILEYVGHESYHRVWAELNKRKAVVFLHGAQIPSSVPYPHEFLGVPITEVSDLLFRVNNVSHEQNLC